MSKSWKIASVMGLAVLLLAVVLAGTAFAQQGTPTPGGVTPAPGGAAAGVGSGMMSGTAVPGGMMGSGTGVTGTLPSNQELQRLMQQMMGSQAGITGTLPFAQNMIGMMMQNMMGGTGMMGNGMMGNGMMGGVNGGWSDPSARPLSADQVVTATQQYIKNLPNNAGAGLAPLEIMEFSNSFYAAVGDKNGGAFEVLIDRYTGAVTPEPGPNMMWNTKYGMMGGQGMMGMMGVWTPQGGTPGVTASQARTNAQSFLDLKFPGTKLPADMMTFPGYYTLDFEKDGKPVGMLSVNAYTGQVWYHTWHAQFLSERAM
jgi:hypothetical protein